MGTTISVIPGDGIGPEIMNATLRVLDALDAGFDYEFVDAGLAALDKGEELLPQATLDSIARNRVLLKGPLTTPVGKGFRSLNVALRQELDLFTCLRPVRWFEGVPSPVKDPGSCNMVIFRENSEDIYAGIEYQAGSEEAQKRVHVGDAGEHGDEHDHD